MPQRLPHNTTEMVLKLPPSYEEAMRTSVADGSAFGEPIAALGFNDHNRNRDIFASRISLPPSYEDSTYVYQAAVSDYVIHV